MPELVADSSYVVGQADTPTADMDDLYPNMTSLANGGFITVWTEVHSDSVASTNYNALIQLFGADGTPVLAQPMALDRDFYGYADLVNVTSLSNGKVVLSWADTETTTYGLVTQVFDPSNVTSSAAVQSNSNDAFLIDFPQTIALKDGRFATTWTSGSSDLDVFMRVFNADGSAQTAEIKVHATNTDSQTLSSITALDDGGFVVGWSSCGCHSSTSAVRVFNADGSARSAEIAVPDNAAPAVAALPDGGFVIAWASTSSSDDFLSVQAYNANGSLRYSGTQQILSSSSFDITYSAFSPAPDLTVLKDGSVVVQVPVDDGTDDEFYSHVFHFSNEAPSASNSTIATLEDTSRVLSASDFGFTDTDGGKLSSVIINSLPSRGTLTLNGTAVAAAESISVGDLNAGKLIWTPPANASGTALASFSFQVKDGGGTRYGGHDTSTTQVLTFNVIAVNDAPTSANATIAVVEDTAYTFALSNLAFNDVDGDTHAAVVINALPSGTLRLGGAAVSAGQVISIADIAAGRLVWTPPKDGNGMPLTALSFSVRDNQGETSATYALSFNVSAVNDAPVLNYHGPTTTPEDSALKLDVLSGASDVDGNALSITAASLVSGFGKLTINKDGTLTYDPTKAPNQDIAKGESKTVTISYTVSDGHGGQATDEIDITVEGVSPDIFRGTAKRDNLTGTSGDDRIFGLANKDRLDGRGGDDIMKGGKHADTFVFGADYGRDTIVDFKPGEGDRIDLSDAVGIKNFNDLMQNHIEDVGKNLVITTDDGSVLVLKRVELDDLDRDSFLF